MPDDSAFIAAVLDAPDDDAPRLVYADWCDDHRRPERALLIRRMVAVPSAVFIWNRSIRAFRPRLLHDGTASPRAIRNLKRDATTVCRDEWGRLPVERVTVRRGFATAVRLRWSDFRTHASALFAAHPIRSVVLSDLCAYASLVLPGRWDATIVEGDECRAEHWPADLFPETESTPARVYYRSHQEAEADLSDRAVAYGRGVCLEGQDPPLTNQKWKRPRDSQSRAA